jgi:pimeloyl-ACP methyl ester carboxylesterase
MPVSVTAGRSGRAPAADLVAIEGIQKHSALSSASIVPAAAGDSAAIPGRIVERRAGEVILPCREFGPPSGPKLLCFHGLIADSVSFSYIAEAEEMAALGFHVIVPDLKGRNLSAHLTSDGLVDHAETVRALMDGIGAAKFSLIGHSHGAFVAVEVAAREEVDQNSGGKPSRIDKVALIDGGLGSAEPGALSKIMRTARSLDKVFVSVDAFIAAVKERGIIEPWSATWEANYRAGLMAVPGGVKLRVNRQAVDNDIGFLELRSWLFPLFALRACRLPRDRTLVLRAGKPMGPMGSIMLDFDIMMFKGWRPDVTFTTIDGATHYSIMTNPLTVGVLSAFMAP